MKLELITDNPQALEPTETQPAVETKPTDGLVPVRNPDGSTRLQRRDEKGRLCSKDSNPGQSFSAKATKKRQSFLDSPDKPLGPTATRAEIVSQKLFEIVKKGAEEPKMAVAAVAAA
jgi:hypothetical protein